jgi:glucose/arabinose dehydrogenase
VTPVGATRRGPITALIAIATMVAATIAPAGPAAAAASPVDPAAVVVRFHRVASGLTKPLFVTHAGDGSDRLFIVEQGGKIRILENGALLPAPFLDLSGSVSTGGEQGLLGLAFHPSYETNHKVYVNYTNTSGNTIVAEYLASAGNPDTVDTSTRRRLLWIDQPYSNHNGGMIAFGPDGYFYIGMGDGGSGGDPGNRAQNLSSLFGKMLRIDVDGTSAGKAYAIPPDNPYVGVSGLDEIWNRGWRNPWRFSFDRATGDLWAGDVGQNKYEEIDRLTAAGGTGRGRNLGWPIMEGRHCYRPSSGCSTSGLTMPLIEYGRSGGCSVTGGYVHRGADSPPLNGTYIYGDFCSGRIWAVPSTAASPASPTLIADTAMLISSFGEDEAGRLYVVDHKGAVYRLEGRAWTSGPVRADPF